MYSMYAYIKGELAEKNIDSIVVEAAGVGYLIYIPTQYFDMLPDEGEDVKIYTYLCVREDAMILYGFLSKDDLEIFKLLITVSGIGPKGGLAILSTLPADDLRFAILSGDSKAISKAPGIGAKTAQRVILDLKDKLSLEDAFEKKLAAPTVGAEVAAAVAGNSVVQDAVEALVALGYGSTESLKAVRSVNPDEHMDVETVLKAALKHYRWRLDRQQCRTSAIRAYGRGTVQDLRPIRRLYGTG